MRFLSKGKYQPVPLSRLGNLVLPANTQKIYNINVFWSACTWQYGCILTWQH